MKTILRSSVLFFWFVFSLPGFLRAADLDSLKIEPLRNRAGQRSIYVVQFSLSDSVSSTAQMRISFPDGFDLSTVKMAGSNSIKGGFTTQVSGNDVVVSRTGKGSALAAGRMYEIMLANITNAPPGTYTVSVAVSAGNGASPGTVKVTTIEIIR